MAAIHLKTNRSTFDNGGDFPSFFRAMEIEGKLSTSSPASLVDLARLFSVSTDYLLGVEPLNTVNVTGLDERDVAILAELADRLRQHKADE